MITRSDRLAHVNYAIRGKVLDAALRLEAAGETILKLNIGNPGVFGFEVNHAMTEAIAEHFLGTNGSQSYSHSKGIYEARAAIVSYHAGRGITGLTAEDIFIGNGGSELIVMTMQGLLNDGDEVLLPAPDYPLWTAAVNLSGGRAVHYRCDEENGWNPDLSDMASKISNRTKAIVLINPNNPTGAVYDVPVLEGIVELAKKHNLLIFSDEIYDRVLYDGAVHTSIAALAGKHPCFTFNGISKTHLACGFRGGWLAISGDKSGIRDYINGLDTLASMRLCSNVMAQYAIVAALERDDLIKSLTAPGGRLFEQRTAAWRELNAIDGVSCVKPKGALYLFPKIDASRWNINDDERFVLDFLEEKKVLLVNGTGFNWATPDHFRVVALPQVDILTDAIRRLGDFLKSYRQA